MSKSMQYLKNILESRNSLEKAIEMNQHFPCVPFYSELQKKQADKLLMNGESKQGFAHLVEAHCVGLRHAAINTQRDKSTKKKLSKTNPLPHDIDNPAETFSYKFDKCLEFGKATFPEWISTVPPEWTVVHVTELWPCNENLRMLGFGPPPLLHNLPKLFICRIQGGHIESVLTKSLERPAGNITGGSLLAELNSILEGNRCVNKDFRGNRDQYWKMKQEHHDQLKVLVDSLENWWLDYSKCLLIGELTDSANVKILERIMSDVKSTLRKLKKELTEEEEKWMRLLISSYCHLNHQQLIRGLVNVLKTTAKNAVVTELVSLLRNAQSELELLKMAKRNPIILVLDKAIQQLPWESMTLLNSTPVSRMPSLHFLNSLTLKHSFDKSVNGKQISPVTDLKLRSGAIQVNPKLAYYIVNPGLDLPGVQSRLQPILEEIWGKHAGLSGIVPVEQQIKQSLTERDIFLYCGHGSGSKYLPHDHLVKLDCRAAPILMGCSSGQLTSSGRIVDPTGAPVYYLIAGSPSMIGMLWEVTDVDCDRFTVRLLDLMLGARKRKGQSSMSKTPPNIQSKKTELPSPPDRLEPEILRAVAASRCVTKNFLTGAAAVVYGLPIRTLKFEVDKV